MNYPVWEVPASGLLIAFVAIVHVFIAHFAVGGGLFLVVAERRARRDADAALLGFVRRHSRFFILVTLVLGTVTGVGIWFTILLVHPAATSTLIQTFVWIWALEWTFFATEIAAALVYYYGWDRLPARTHMAVGWIYFGAAWASLAIINGILTFMLTPGRWLDTGNVWHGWFNPTYMPSLVARTAAAAGLAGIYALLTGAWERDPELKARVARFAGFGWVIPAAIVLPLALLWYLHAAAGTGVPVAEVLGAAGSGIGPILAALLAGGADSGFPPAQRAALFALGGSLAALLLVLYVVALRPRAYGRTVTAVLLACGLLALGGAEWVREDLRKPYVIAGHMYVNGVRAAVPPRAGGPVADRFTAEALSRDGVLAVSAWARLPQGYGDPGAQPVALDPETLQREEAAAGREVFKVLCSSCHSVDGYLAIRPLVRGKSVGALDGLLERLAGWRGRRMPPFTGTAAERVALAVYLAQLGGGAGVTPSAPVPQVAGARVFQDNCGMCHGAGSEWPIGPLLAGRNADALYHALGRLPELNEMMPAFEGSEDERRALAAFLASLDALEQAP
ncbi:MAG: c-type cytochrome [Acidobacteria bacterium]|nr:c-type cytochrome [Acidobacteriota bacterium]